MTTEKYDFGSRWYEFDIFDVEIRSTRRVRVRKPSLWSTSTQEIDDWCIQHFGPPGGRWFWSSFVFNFRDQEDYTLFLLRWS
jgi:hypothetical protein